MISIGHTEGDIIMTPVAKVQDLAYAVTHLGRTHSLRFERRGRYVPLRRRMQGERIWKLVPAILHRGLSEAFGPNPRASSRHSQNSRQLNAVVVPCPRCR